MRSLNGPEAEVRNSRRRDCLHHVEPTSTLSCWTITPILSSRYSRLCRLAWRQQSGWQASNAKVTAKSNPPVPILQPSEYLHRISPRPRLTRSCYRPQRLMGMRKVKSKLAKTAYACRESLGWTPPDEHYNCRFVLSPPHASTTTNSGWHIPAPTTTGPMRLLEVY